MEGLLCPECLSVLEVSKDNLAVCPAHGDFRVLYSRAETGATTTVQAIEQSVPLASEAAPSAHDAEAARALAVLGLQTKPRPVVARPGAGAAAVPEGKCVKHPKTDAVQTCSQCNAAMCRMCTYRSPYGKRLCAACLSGDAGSAEASNPGGAERELSLQPSNLAAEPLPSAAGSAPATSAAPPKKVNPYMVGIMCATHADMQANFKCKLCSKGVCETCDFKVGGVHLCPECVMKPRDAVSGKRVKYVVAGFVVVVLTVFLFLMGSFHHETALIILSMISGLVGVAVSMFPLERNLRNSVSMWVGAALNVVMLAMFVLIMVIGIFKRH